MAPQSLVRPWVLILGGSLYGAKISVQYYLCLFPYTVRPTLYRVLNYLERHRQYATAV